MKRIATTIGIAALTTLVAGCGGDSLDYTETDTDTDTTFDRSGNAINSYLVGAVVCVDVNFNNRCNSSEPSDTSAGKGSFSLTTASASAPTLVVARTSNTKQTNFNGSNASAVDSNFELRAPARAKVVTPLTTIVQTEAERRIANNDVSTANAVSQATSAIENTLSNNGVDLDVLNSDYIDDGNDKAAATSKAVRELIQTTRAKIDDEMGNDGSGDGSDLARNALSARKINDKLAGIATQIVGEIDGGASASDAADTASNDANNEGNVDNNVSNEISEVLADIEEAEQVAEEDEEDATGATGGSGS